MDELEQLRRKRFQELNEIRAQQDVQSRDGSGIGQESQAAHQMAALEAIVKKKLSKKALERYGNIKAADPHKAMQLLLIFGQVLQSTDISEVSDEQFRELLEHITPKKRDIRINKK